MRWRKTFVFWSMVKPRAIPWYCEMLDMSVEDSHVDYLSWIKRLNFTVIISWNIQPKIRTNQTTRKGWTKGVYLFLQPFPPQCQVSQVSNLIKMTSTGQRQRPLLKSGLQKSWMSCPILTQSEKNITWKKKWMNSSRGWCKILIQSLQFNGAYILFVRSRLLWLIVFVRRLHIISAISNEPLQNISWFSLVAVSGMMITNAKALCPQLHRIPATFSPKSFLEVTPIPHQQRTEAFVVVVSSLKWFRVDGFHWSILHACSKISGQWTFMNFHEFSGTPRPTFCSFSMRCQLILAKTISWSYCWWQWSCDERVSRNPKKRQSLTCIYTYIYI